LTEQFRCQDPRGKTIVCEDRNWKAHAEKHTEIAGQEAAVLATLEQPLAIYQDARDLNRQVYYRPNVLPGVFSRSYMRVVVHFPSEHQRDIDGYVTTAFAVEPGSVPRRGEAILWPED
jgi:hypothetical protein